MACFDKLYKQMCECGNDVVGKPAKPASDKGAHNEMEGQCRCVEWGGRSRVLEHVAIMRVVNAEP